MHPYDEISNIFYNNVPSSIFRFRITENTLEVAINESTYYEVFEIFEGVADAFLQEDNLGNHIPIIDKVLEPLGMTCESMENTWDIPEEVQDTLQKTLIAAGWVPDSTLNFNN